MAKHAITIIASEETYKNLQPFQDIKQLNEAVRAYKEQFGGQLTNTALSVLGLLQRYAAKFTGVCFLTKNNIAEKLEISRRTVIRACQLLEQLGIIRQYEMKRKSDMRQTSNAIVIQPADGKKVELVTQEEFENAVESSTQEEGLSHQKTISFKTNTFNNNHLNINRSSYIKFVPKSLQHFQAIFGKQVKDLYGRVWLAVKNLGISTPEQDIMQQIGFIALEKVKQYIKDGKALTSEEQCKIVYKIAYKQLIERLDRGDIVDETFNYDYDCLLKRGVIL